MCVCVCVVIKFLCQLCPGIRTLQPIFKELMEKWVEYPGFFQLSLAPYYWPFYKHWQLEERQLYRDIRDPCPWEFELATNYFFSCDARYDN